MNSLSVTRCRLPTGIQPHHPEEEVGDQLVGQPERTNGECAKAQPEDSVPWLRYAAAPVQTSTDWDRQDHGQNHVKGHDHPPEETGEYLVLAIASQGKFIRGVSRETPIDSICECLLASLTAEFRWDRLQEVHVGNKNATISCSASFCPGIQQPRRHGRSHGQHAAGDRGKNNPHAEDRTANLRRFQENV